MFYLGQLVTRATNPYLHAARLTADDVATIDEAGKQPPSALRGQRHLVPKQSTVWLGVFITVAIVVILLRFSGF